MCSSFSGRGQHAVISAVVEVHIEADPVFWDYDSNMDLLSALDENSTPTPIETRFGHESPANFLCARE